ncbi:helix-turn-helix domain-containing protein, partial [Mycobacteroides abscessus subsp. massiliense]
RPQAVRLGALLDEVRETLARELLRNGFSVREVSDRLGYSEPAAFTHAYTRWRGMPPSAR